ncbi:MAG: helicase, partial [Candidatus Marinimicrobia bacterium CG08_land_8_20_14_0_20_45_22]
MPHQIIDNRTRKLADEINQQLEYTEKAKIAVGYFFLSGLESIEKRLQEKEPDGSFQIKEVRLLIGNVSNKSTIEELARGYRRLNTISKELERQNYPKSRERQIEVLKALNDVRDVISDVEQNDENQRLIQLLHQMIVEQRLKVKVYVKSRLHAKAYIFDFKNPQPQSKGIAIVGSSNLSLAGLTNNTELNVYVHDNGENHDELTRWFDNLWNDAEDFDTALFQEMAESWAIRPTTPYEIYIKTLYELVKDRIEGTDDREFLWQNEITEALTDFQNKAVKIIIGIIRQYGGAFASDVVGIGKSFIGAAVVKHFSITENAKPLIICPKSLEDMWRNYNAEYSLNAEVLPMSLLRESISEDDEWNLLVSDVKYRDRDFILIDESHHFRHQSPERYKILQDFMQTGNKKVLLLTATPRNKSAMDVYNQIKLFHTSDTTIIPINPPNLKDYFKKIQDKNTPTSEAKNLFRSLLQFILVRRTRQHILKWYGFDSKTHLKVDP